MEDQKFIYYLHKKTYCTSNNQNQKEKKKEKKKEKGEKRKDTLLKTNMQFIQNKPSGN